MADECRSCGADLPDDSDILCAECSYKAAEREPLPLVKGADEMNVETFLKHINARHTPIGKMDVFGRSNIPGDDNESLLRAYHDKIHESYDDGFTSKYSNEKPLNHRHRSTPEESK